MPKSELSSELLAALVGRGEYLALRLAGPEQWHERDGYTFLAAELPGGVVETPDDPESDAKRICARQLRGRLTLRPSCRVYGPSPRHAIDVLQLEEVRRPLPLLQLVRLLPAEPDRNAPRAVTLRVYLTATPGGVGPADGVGGLLWLTPRALRIALLGAPLDELLAEEGVDLQCGPGVHFPNDAFVFVPGEYGERHLVRIAAKYGPEALFQWDDPG